MSDNKETDHLAAEVPPPDLSGDAAPAAEIPPVEVEPAPVATAAPDVPAATPAAAPAAPAAPAAEEGKKPEIKLLGQTFGQMLYAESLTEADLPDPVTGTTGPVGAITVEQEFEVDAREPGRLNDDKDFREAAMAGKPIIPILAERGPEVDDRISARATLSTFNTREGQAWNGVLRTSTQSASKGNQFHEVTRRPGSQWRQALHTQTGPLGYSAPRTDNSAGEKLTGERAALRVRAILGFGGLVTIPLYHSGFTITLQAPREGSVIELYRRIMEEKIDLGRMTYGLVFSNEQSYIQNIVMEFCRAYIYESSLRVEDATVLDYVKSQDIPIIVNAMARLIWPQGFYYSRALTTVEGIDNHQVVTGRINIAKLLWVDNAGLTERQRALLSRRARGSITVADLETYDKEFLLSAGRQVRINDSLALNLSVPTASEMAEDGNVWISGIVELVDSTFTQTAPDESARNEQINIHARAARLRKYGAWVKSVEIDGQEADDAEAVMSTLEALSKTDEVEKIEREIKKFMDDTTVALIAIPETSGQESGLPRFPHLIALDVLNTFFILLSQKIMKLG